MEQPASTRYALKVLAAVVAIVGLGLIWSATRIALLIALGLALIFAVAVGSRHE